MKYTLITRNGSVMQFFLLSTAELYQQIKGGTLITDQLYAEVYAELLAEPV